METSERDIATWRDIVEELERLLEFNDGRTHGRLVRSWLVDQRVSIGELEPAGKERS